MNLPVTKFNMRANSVQREPELQRQWAEQRTYEQLRDANPGVSVLLCFQLSFDSAAASRAEPAVGRAARLPAAARRLARNERCGMARAGKHAVRTMAWHVHLGALSMADAQGTDR